MDDFTKFFIERMDKLREELRNDFKEIVSNEVVERKAMNKRVTSLEVKFNKAMGGALVISGIASWAMRKFGG